MNAEHVAHRAARRGAVHRDLRELRRSQRPGRLVEKDGEAADVVGREALVAGDGFARKVAHAQLAEEHFGL